MKVSPFDAVSRYTGTRIQQMAHAKLIRRPKGYYKVDGFVGVCHLRSRNIAISYIQITPSLD